jgi:flagellar hook assembly protein FlgD
MKHILIKKGESNKIDFILTIIQSTNSITLSHNQFNPTKGELLKIGFYLEKEEEIEIKIFNLAGSIIRVFNKKSIKEGIIEWDGKNKDNKIVGTGVYLIHIKAGEFKETKRVLVLK